VSGGQASRPRGAALEDRAELLSLREQADRAAAEVAQTLTELTDRLALAARPGAAARRVAAAARDDAARTARQAARRVAGWPAARRAALAALPALAAAAAVAVLVARARARRA
jgi:ABC-type transporter Mla subunit MlaD